MKVEAIVTATSLVKYRSYLVTHVSCHQAKLDPNATFPFRLSLLHLSLYYLSSMMLMLAKAICRHLKKERGGQKTNVVGTAKEDRRHSWFLLRKQTPCSGSEPPRFAVKSFRLSDGKSGLWLCSVVLNVKLPRRLWSTPWYPPACEETTNTAKNAGENCGGSSDKSRIGQEHHNRFRWRQICYHCRRVEMGRQETAGNCTGRDGSADAADQSYELHPAANTQKSDDDRIYQDVRRALQQAGPLDRDELGY